ncbi:GLPGLI family protein [Larkinella insperata]|uniref:GLPGLI family protein n=1 Tax=Larkinella insperata TaxID=332158 RepID=A0ABW3QGZ2_9BACT|nr:GLPGLI family protein [Larkinella insperata]
MKTFPLIAVGILAAQTAFAQPKSGKITYEVMQKVDLSQMRIVINGQEVRPGSPDAPAVDLPETRSFLQYFVFAGNHGKEEQDGSTGGITIRQFSPDSGPESGPGGPEGRRSRNFSGRPFERSVFIDLAAQKTVEVVTIKKDSVTKHYQTELPLNRATGWQESGKSKKIAGFTCQKATVAYRNVTYTVWYTTDLPFTYSPVPSLTPEKGVVLQIESDQEAYKATKIAEQNVAESDVMPPKTAQMVTPDELALIRQKAMADMRQKVMNDFQNRN